ncbi:hypothetical protein Tsubulata_010922 [Turnera subulata]|uniref:Uncharacterized protein n=1 Tax=Turnera subulata TaxID=218843 RepID=A0A9Q0F421_9ROSI|nr:hypothetical protein Tsubulata_010922 [Turnera subulata]
MQKPPTKVIMAISKGSHLLLDRLLGLFLGDTEATGVEKCEVLLPFPLKLHATKHRTQFSFAARAAGDDNTTESGSSSDPKPTAADSDQFESRLSEPVADGLKVEFGFSPYSERVNGRIAMLGLAALLLVELATGKSVVNYHTPAIVFIQVYFVAAVAALYVKYEKEKTLLLVHIQQRSKGLACLSLPSIFRHSIRRQVQVCCYMVLGCSDVEDIKDMGRWDMDSVL